MPIPTRSITRPRHVLLLLVAVIAIALAVALIREPRPDFAPSAPRPGVTLHDLTFAGRSYAVCEIDPARAPLRLFWKRPDGSRYATFAALNADHPLAFATNAGIFDPTFAPCGLHAADGRELIPLNTRDGPGNFYLRPNGVFVIDDDHGPRILETGKYPGTTPRTRLATQSGPMLVIDGALPPQFAPDSPNRRTRSGVGVRAADRAAVVFALSREPVTFHEFATLFQQRLGCPDALYLDGEISRFYTPGDASPPDGNFAGILAVTAR